jgi:hypothetical protein
MSPFNFRSVQSLELSSEDKPTVRIENDFLVLTATRGDEQIQITAPVSFSMPVTTTVTAPNRADRRLVRKPSSRIGIPVRGGEKRAGELNKMAKLTDAAVREIKMILADPGMVKKYKNRHALYQDIAKAYGVHHATIKNVATNISWKHITI